MISPSVVTHPLHAQVVLTTIQPKAGGKSASFDAYEYTAHSHTFQSDSVPSMRVSFDMSPIQVSPCMGSVGAMHAVGEVRKWR